MKDQLEIENRAGIGRITCGWKRPELSLDLVRRYWRDVHSPGIARRPGMWEYRHLQFDPVRADLLAPVAGVDYRCAADAQLMWVSDVRYLDQAGLDAFGAAPSAEIKALMLADIELIVHKSTTYLALGQNAHTYVDRTGAPAPQGPLAHPGYSLFLRQRSTESAFRAFLTELAARWAVVPGVLRLRLTLFEVPDMEAERKAGYPVKTHPPEQQYQAWIDLVVSDDAVASRLLVPELHGDFAQHIATVHAYPTPVTYTPVYRGRPTLVGLRGYPAYDAIRGLQATNQQELRLLNWMYGERVQGGPFA